jgi:hypothetical protein
MTRALAIVMFLAAAAHADSIVAPAGWHADDAKAADQAARLRKLPHFGGAPTEYGVGVYAPATPGIVLYLTRLSTTSTSPMAIRSAIDDFELAAHETGVQVGDTSKRVDDAKKQIEATIGLRDRGAQLETLSVLLAAADAKHLVVVTGDCIAREDVDPKLLDACRMALTTIDPDVKPADRVAIALPTSDTPTPSEPSQTPTPSNGSHMDDGSHVALPPIVVADQAQSDRRPIYIGAGLIVLAAVFWWNRKRREKFAREDGVDEPAPKAAAKAADDDSDDLHAAAAGEDDKDSSHD